MNVKSTFVDAPIQEYIIERTVREAPILAELRLETASMPRAGMQIGPEQGQFMALIGHLTGARRYLEVGVFTGYSALAMALSMPEDARIVACDVSEEYTAVARRYWTRAGVAGRIDLRLGPALETLDALLGSGAEPFDVAFIDADKENVDNYYERCLKLVRPGGVVLVDNVLWSGAVIDPSDNDVDTAALRALVAKAGKDERVDVSLLPLCDGLLIARKR
jgi:predicted O-methyltransferase YrrM